MDKKHWLIICCVCLFVGYAAASVRLVNPLYPERPDRPVLAFLAKVAKLGLWLTLALEPNPDPQFRSVPCGAVCHSEGW